MRFYQPFALAALVGLVAASPISFNEDAIAVASDSLVERQAAKGTQTAAAANGKGKGKAAKGKGKGKAAKGKGKGKGKAKKGKKRGDEVADMIDDILERSAEAEPINLAEVDTVVVARTPELEIEDIVERSPAPHHKGKGGKGGKAGAAGGLAGLLGTRQPHHKGKGGKAGAAGAGGLAGLLGGRDVEEIVERSPAPHHKGKGGKGKAAGAGGLAGLLGTREPQAKGKGKAKGGKGKGKAKGGKGKAN